MFNIRKLLAQRLVAGFQHSRPAKVPSQKITILPLEDRLVPAPLPVVSALGTQNILLGENASYSFTFSNASGTDTGFSPFIEVAVDTSGADGGGTPDGYGTPVVNAGGLPLIPIQVVNLTAANQAYTNTFANNTPRVSPAGYGAGDTIFIYQLPFGSFTPLQSTAVTITAPTSNFADVGTPLPIAVTPGFRDDNATTPFAPSFGPQQDGAATPELWRLTKTYIGPESETATGPNFKRQYRLDIDIATGQTITNLQLTDLLPNTMQWTGAGNTTQTIQGSPIALNLAGTTANATTPGGNIVGNFGSVTGVAGIDASMTFEFYVPRDTSGGSEILPQPTPPAPNPAGGTDSFQGADANRSSENNARSDGNWDPLDPRDAATNVTINPTGPEHTLQEHSVAVQKSATSVNTSNVATPIAPGLTLVRYDITFQVSDYYAVNNLFVQDVIGDGQRLYLAPGFAPTLTVNNAWTSAGTRAAPTTGAFTLADVIDYQRRYNTIGSSNTDPSVAQEGYTDATGPGSVSFGGIFNEQAAAPGATGSTFLQFNVSDELINRGLTGLLVGGEIADGGGNPQNNNPTAAFGGATGTITYWVLVKEEYSDDFPSGDPSVDQGDTLTNGVPLIQADHLSPTDLADGTPTPLGTTGTDNSGTTLTIPRGEETKTVFAINGTTIPPQAAADTVFSVQAGDRITYKLTYNVPLSRFESLTLVDLPPLPVMAVGLVGQYTLNTGAPTFANYEVAYAPDDTFFSTFNRNPTLSTDPTANSITFDYGTFDDLLDRNTTISLLLTLPVSGDPFVSDLFLTNQLRVNEGNTFLGTTTVEDLRRIQLVRPDVTIDKGVVGVNANGFTLGGIPFNVPNTPPTAPSTPSFTGIVNTAGEAAAIGASGQYATPPLVPSTVYNPVFVDANDRVRYGIVAQNNSRADAYDVIIRDTIPTEYGTLPATFAGLNLQIYHGNGATPALVGQEVDFFARVATTGTNLNLTNLPTTLDGVTLAAGDLILVKDQTNPAQNGLYVVSINTNTGIVSASLVAGSQTAGARIAVAGGRTAANADNWFVASAGVTYTVQGSTPDYFAIYDIPGRAFQILLADNYSAGNTNFANQTPDNRSGSLSRSESTPLVNAGDTPVVTPITNGSNTVVILYDLTLPANVDADAIITNTATLTNYGAEEGGTDLTNLDYDLDGTPDPDPFDTATVAVIPTITKVLVSTEVTEPGNNTGSAAGGQVVVGELVTYTVTATLPEGVTNGYVIFDTFDPGLAFVEITDVNFSSSEVTSSLAGFSFANNGAANAATLQAAATIPPGPNGGGTVRFDLGTLTNNTALNNGVAETITITYRAIVLNVAGNQAGTTLGNFASESWTVGDVVPTDLDGNALATGVEVSANDVTVVEPTVDVQKDVRNATNGGTFGQTAAGDNNDVFRYRVALTATPTGSGGTTAFDVSFSDQIPAQFNLATVGVFATDAAADSLNTTIPVTGVVRRNGTVVTSLSNTDFQVVAGLVTFAPGVSIDMEPGAVITFDLRATFRGATGVTVTNTANVQWTSIDGVRTDRSTFNTASDERTGAGGVNDYADSDTADIESPPLVRKTIVATSEPSTATTPAVLPAAGGTAANVAVGEVVRYRIYVSIGETAVGSPVSNFTVQDNLPAGLRFINDGSARYGFISTTGTAISSATNGLGTNGVVALPNAGIIGNEATLATLASSSIVGTFGDSNIAPVAGGEGLGLDPTDIEPGLYASGQDVFFRFGDLTNAAANDPDNEFVVLEFNVLVENVVGNQDTTPLSNDFSLLVDTNPTAGLSIPGYISVVQDIDGSGTRNTGDVPVTATDSDNNLTTGPNTPANSAAVTVTVVEPTVTIAKTVRNETVTPGGTTFVNNIAADAGDVLEFQIVLGNTGTSDAFDINLTDALPAGVTYVAGSLAQTGTALTTLSESAGTITATFAGTSADGFDNGETITITFRATVNSTVTPNQNNAATTNTANVTWTSLFGADRTTGNLPFFGTVASTLGAPGTPTGERTGADGVGGALNDYAASDPASFTVPAPTLVKSLFSTSLAGSTTGSNVAVGEQVTYALLVTLPESTVASISLVDLIPSGLQYLTGSATLVTTAASSGGLLAANFAGTVGSFSVTGGASNGDDVTLSFGSTVTTDDNVTNNNSFLVLITARVLNVPGNEGILPGQTTLDNSATLDVPGGGTPDSTSGPVTITVVEPQLQNVKTITSDDTVDAAATLTYQVVVSHTANSTGPAFDVVVTDTLPTSVTFNVGSVVVQVLDSSNNPVAYSPTVTDTSVAETLTITVSELRPGDRIVITYSADVDGPPAVTAVAPGGTIVNTVTTDYDTFPGTNPDERNEPDVTGTATATINTYALGGVIWSDLDNDGVFDSGTESLITGQTVTLNLTGTDHLSNPVDLTVTTTNGTYSFTGLRPGTYSVAQINQPTGFLDGRDGRNDDGFPGTNYGGTGTLATDNRGPTATPIPGRDADAISTITIPLNQTQDGTANVGGSYNFGEIQPATLGDFVWEDLNGNGVQDPTETPALTGVTGVQVVLTGTDDTGRVVSFTTTTGANGAYQFPDLRPSTTGYTATFTAPAGYYLTYANQGADDTADSDAGTVSGTVGATGAYPIAAGDSQQTVDAGLYRPVTIGDFVWYDLDRSGTVNTVSGVNEATLGVPNAVVRLLYAGPDGTFGTGDDGAVLTTTTDAAGNYLFGDLATANLIPGNYRVVVDPTPTVGSPTITTTGTTTTIANDTQASNSPANNRSNVSDLARDFGVAGAGRVGDTVFIDFDKDGIADPNEGIAGVRVFLTGDLDGDGTAETLTTTTNAAGVYDFPNLRTTAAGVPYTVTVDTTTLPSPDLVNVIDPDTANPGDNTSAVTLTNAAAVNLNQDFGYRGVATVGDRVWVDQNGNDLQDSGEPGIPNATVVIRWSGQDGILDNADDLFFTTTTGANGLYLFTELPVYTRGGTNSDPYRVTVTALPVAGLNPTTDLDDFDPGVDPVTGDTAAFQVTNAAGGFQNRRDVDFGYDGLSGLAGTVFRDDNNNGVQDGGEPGIAGVVLELTGVDVLGNVVIDPNTGVPYRATTNAAGDYIFNTVVPGTYTITETQPVAYNDGIDTPGTLGGSAANDIISGIVVSQAGLFGPEYNFGELGTFLSGTVYRDDSRDGTIQPGEPGIGGVVVVLTGGPDNVNLTATTAADGTFRFDDIPAGSYTVTETQPAGYADSPVGPATVITPAVVPLAGLPNQNFGEVLGRITGSVFIDANDNGVRDTGEVGIPNATVVLTGTDANGAVNRTAATDANGDYVFDNLLASTGAGYTVTETQPAPYQDGQDTVDNVTPVAGSNLTDVLTPIPLAAGATDPQNNFGELTPTNPFIAGSVFRDDNRDGARQSGEPAIPGVTITLLDAGTDGVVGTADDGPAVTATTDANGNFLFTELITGGNYQILETQPGIYGNSPVGPTVLIPVTNLPATGSTGNNFPEVLGSLAGNVYFDANTNGTRDPGEPGIGGVPVVLTGTDVNGAAVPATTATTAADGSYLFTLLPAGTYTVTEPTQPANYTDGLESAGSAGGVAGNDVITQVPLSAGNNLTAYNFGEVGVPVSGRVFYDRNRNGGIEAGDTPIPGVRIELIDAVGTVVAATTTAADGTYLFPNVAPGTYTVREIQPNGYGNPPAGAFAPDTRPIAVTNFAVINQNFGDTLSTLAGAVYVDNGAGGGVANDGVRNGTEAGIANVPVVLDWAGPDNTFGTVDDATGVATLFTAANGNYQFTDLVAGTYRVREATQPAPYTDGLDTAGSAGGAIGVNDQIDAIPVGTGVDLTAYNFGELPPANPFIAGTVYIDQDRDGVRDPGEPAIPGVTVVLTGPGAPVTVTTDAAGNYVFPDLTASQNYTVTETQPATFGNSPNGPATVISVNNLPAAGSTGNNFGEVGASLSGSVYVDANNNGVRDGGEVGIPGTPVTLAGTDAAGNPVFRATTTDASGNYTFADLPASNGTGYTVAEPTQPAGFNDGTDAAGNFGAGAVGTAGNDVINTVVVPAGGTGVRYDFGELLPPSNGTTTIAGTVFHDRDRDATLDPGENPIGGVVVQLLDAGGNVISTTTTAADGTYLFTNVVPGTYTVVETQPAGYGSSTPNTVPVTVPVSLVPVTGIDFGETLASLAGSVYIDADNNGLRALNEVGIGGVPVTLTGTDATGATVNRTTFTDATGNYVFDDLFSGTYTVTEPLQPAPYTDGLDTAGSAGGNNGTNDVLSSVPVGVGAILTDYNFGERSPANAFIAGSVYVDTNDNGVRDGGEPGIPGTTVVLTGPGGPLTVTTDAAGNYVFPNLTAGQNYTVTETQPAAYGNGIEAPTNVIPVNNLPATGSVDNNFGERAGSLRGTVYEDIDNNGSFNGVVDAGIPGVTVTLLQGGTPVATTTTDAFGNYVFANLPTGTYTVAETQPAGYTTRTNTPGTGTTAAGTVAGDQIQTVVLGLTGGQPQDGVQFNFGEVRTNPPVPTTIAGTVYVDANRDATLQTGETPINGVVLQLRDAGGNVIATTTTAPDGTYLFTGIFPGTYTITEVQPAGYASTTPNVLTVPVAGTPVTGQNFGETLATLAGSVYVDLNVNGVQDPGEPGISGAVVVLTGTDANGNAVNRTASTDGNGDYLFTNLLGGTYTVSEVQPNGYPDGQDAAGTVNGTPTGTTANDVLSAIAIPAGGAGIDYDFGELRPITLPGTSSISGTVYIDANRTTAIDPGEVGLPAVTVELLDGTGTVIATTTTLPGGTYSFNNLPAGNYSVRETQPTGYASTTPDLLAVTIPATLVPVTNVDFGEVGGDIRGTVYFDANNNGVQDPSEPGLGGVSVVLTGGAAPVTATTDANGDYAFTNLLAGTYTVTEAVQPTGFADGQDTFDNVTPVAGSDTTDVLTPIVLPAGGSDPDNNFGELAPTTTAGTTFVTGTVWRDLNRDGVLDPNEPGIPGVTVDLYDAAGNFVATTTTGPDGGYVFTNVPPGNYTVRETQPAAFGSSTPNVVAISVPPSLVPVTGIDFGEITSGLSGSVYQDLNRNGVRDAGEPGIGNTTVTLTGADVNGNPVNRVTTTNVGGNYVFSDLPAGTYQIDETQPAGYADGQESLGAAGGAVANDQFSAIPLGAGVLAGGYDYGEIGLNSVGGFVYLDLNLSGTRDAVAPNPDVGFGGGTVSLNGGNTTGQPAITVTTPPFLVVLTGTDRAGNPVTRSTTTLADGSYSFPDLPAGDYTISQQQPISPILVNLNQVAGLYQGADTTGTVNGTPRGTSPAKDQLSVTLNGDATTPAEDGIEYNFGELPPADPFGFVFVDLNANGIREAGEPGIAGVAITISGTAFAGTPFARPLVAADIPGGSLTVLTDANGRYEFVPIPPGLYTLTEAQPAGFLDGLEENADPNGQPGAPVTVGNDVFGNLNVQPFPIRGPFNFGEIRPASISGSVYNDLNNNGVREPGEPGIPGVVMTLRGTDFRGTPVGPVTTTTDANGNFTFGNLLPGQYSVAEAQPVAFGQGQTTPGSSGGILVATDIIGIINLGPGVDAVNYLFGEITPIGPVPALPVLPPIVSIAPGAVSKRSFLASSLTIDYPVEPNYAAIGSIVPGAPRFLTTADGEGGELVRVFDLGNGQERFRFRPFPGNPGGTRVATAEVTGDGAPDAITVPGPGTASRVIVYSGANGSVALDLRPFEAGFTGGSFVAAGDFNRDGTADIVVSADVGGGPRVIVFDGATGGVLADFLGIDDPNFRGGTRVAVGDVNGDGTPDLVVAAGVGGGPRVAVFDGRSVAAGSPTRLVADFFAFEDTLRNGVYVTVGDVDGDGFGDLIFGAGPGGAPRVLGFSGASLVAGQLTPVVDFFAGDTALRGGVPVASIDTNADGTVEIVTGSAPGSLPIVRFFEPTGVLLNEFFAERQEFLGGVYVG